MYRVAYGSRAGTLGAALLTAVVAVSLMVVGAEPAYAIPSPELVVGSLSSISQLIALGSAILGGGAAAFGARALSRGKGQKVSPWPVRIAFGFMIVFAASAAMNTYQYITQRNDRQTRLEANLQRPMPNIGGQALDSTLKEVSYGDQLKHPRGISTADLETLVEAKSRGERDDVILLDIRETAETEMGTLPGAKIVRFPDIAKANLDLAGKKPIVFCHNGNRGYETCQALAALGIDCRFLVGGLEKWLVEGRSLTGLKARTLADLRAVPTYKNQGILLDTPAVHDLIDNENAVFVDVRYPGEFASSPLPGAINLPIRPTPSAELKSRIAQLPHRPIVAPCYDRRSCFFAEVLGLELDRSGLDFRGRYTVPSEYFIPTQPRPYIKEWLAEAHKSWWDKASTGLAGVLSAVGAHIGLIAAILLLALLSRLMVLPVSMKSERDQIKSRALADELAALKARLKSDPRRLGRAMSSFYKRHGLTPVRNLLGLLFLPVMAVSVTAVQHAAADHGGSLLWVPTIADRDPLFVLPVLFAALIALYLDVAFARSRAQRVLIWLITLPVLTATGSLLSAAADIYMMASAALLLVQRAAVSGQFGRMREFWRAKRDDGVIALSDVDRLVGCGNKAYRLAQMRSQGIAVPDGRVLTTRFLAEFAAATPQWRRRKLDRLWRQLGAAKVAVRSSAGAEDGSEYSFAGVFESVLNVDRAGLEKAISEVMASFEGARVESYGINGADGNVLVQRMVDAEYAGVMFTQDPAANGLAIVELVHGTAEKLVSGAVAPEAFRCGRMSGRPIGQEKPPIDLTPLVQIGQRAEAIFKAPQDIEWTYRDGNFYLVQSRDITAIMDAGDCDSAMVRHEEARVLKLAAGDSPDKVVLAQNELAEMLPRPTPLSMSMMEAMWASGGSVDAACRSLGLDYHVEEDQPGYLVTVFGRLYVDKRQEQARAPKLSALALRRLEKRSDRIERGFREEFLPDFVRDITVREAIDFDRLATPDIFGVLEQTYGNFMGFTHVAVDIINISASIYLEQAKKMLWEIGLDPATCLANVPESIYTQALADAAAAPRGIRHSRLVAGLGHRAVLDYELAQPRYEETPELLNALCESQTATGMHAAPTDASLMGGSPKMWEAVRRARRFQTLKEDAKHQSLRELAVCRRAVLALDRRLGLDGLAFFLTFEELLSLRDRPVDELRETASERHHQADVFREVAPLPSTLTIVEIEEAASGIEHDSSSGDAGVRGTRVSGSGVVQGRVRLIAAADAESGAPIAGLQDGDIVVSSMVHPAWLPYFRHVGGFVCEVGGWLSHTAIVARELNLPMVVGTRGIRTIVDGSLIRLNLDGSVEMMEEEAAEPLRAVAAA